jgi:phage shock protein C
MDGRQLTKSQTNKRIAGVCGGIAEYFSIDPTLVRVAFVIGAIVAAPAVIVLYGVLWIVLPEGEKGVPVTAHHRAPVSAIRIAEDRFARGEIDADELAQIRADLVGG